MAGPIRMLRPNTAPNRPWYWPRSEGANRSPMMASAMGNRAPAPSPWMPRAAMNCHISCDSPDSMRADQEHTDTEQEDGPPAEHVRQLPVQRPADGRREQVRGERPRVEVVAVEVGDDPRERRADHRLVECCQEDPDHDRTQDAHPDRMRQLDWGAVDKVSGGHGISGLSSAMGAARRREGNPTGSVPVVSTVRCRCPGRSSPDVAGSPLAADGRRPVERRRGRRRQDQDVAFLIGCAPVAVWRSGRTPAPATSASRAARRTGGGRSRAPPGRTRA